MPLMLEIMSSLRACTNTHPQVQIFELRLPLNGGIVDDYDIIQTE